MAHTSTFNYDSSVLLQSVDIQDAGSWTVSFITDVNGRVLQRDECDNKSTGDPRELHYCFQRAEGWGRDRSCAMLGEGA